LISAKFKTEKLCCNLYRSSDRLVFIFGGYGCGKTILLVDKAIQKANEENQKPPNERNKVIFITMENRTLSSVKKRPKLIQLFFLEKELKKHGIIHKTCPFEYYLETLSEMLHLNADHHIFIDEIGILDPLRKWIIMDILINHAQLTTGYFWCAATGDILVNDKKTNFNFIGYTGNVIKDVIHISKEFQLVNLERPMRNSGDILKYACSTLTPCQDLDFSKLFPFNEQLHPQSYKVEIKGCEAKYVDLRLMEAFNEMKVFEDLIVVLLPDMGEEEKGLVRTTIKVAKDAGFKEVITYLPYVFDELPANLGKFRGVLITNIDLYQGCEAKLIIAVALSKEDVIDSSSFVKSNVVLRCVTKLIVVELDQEKKSSLYAESKEQN